MTLSTTLAAPRLNARFRSWDRGTSRTPAAVTGESSNSRSGWIMVSSNAGTLAPGETYTQTTIHKFSAK